MARESLASVVRAQAAGGGPQAWGQLWAGTCACVCCACGFVWVRDRVCPGGTCKQNVEFVRADEGWGPGPPWALGGGIRLLPSRAHLILPFLLSPLSQQGALPLISLALPLFPALPYPMPSDLWLSLGGFSRDRKLSSASVSIHEPTQSSCFMVFKSLPWHPGCLPSGGSQSNRGGRV